MTDRNLTVDAHTPLPIKEAHRQYRAARAAEAEAKVRYEDASAEQTAAADAWNESQYAVSDAEVQLKLAVMAASDSESDGA